jgi:hypothetical protein
MNLLLTIVRVTDLPAAVDAYVVLEHPAFDHFRSDVVRQSQAPEYQEPFLCGMTPAQLAEPLVARVFASADAIDDTLLGEASIDLRALTAAGHLDPAVTLTAPAGAYAGTLALSIVDRDRRPASLLEAVEAAAAPSDLDAWRDRMKGDVERLGFLEAWEKRLPEIVHVHDSGAVGRDLIGAQLEAWMKRDPDLAAAFDELPLPEKVALDASLVPGVVPLFEGLESTHPDEYLGALRDILERAVGHDEIFEGDGKPMKCLTRVTFENWGRTVKNVPALTCLPRTKKGIMNLVRWATANHKKVRVSGYRHTWESLYASDDQVLVSLLPLNVVEDLPARHPPIDPANELQGIKLVGEIVDGGVKKALCRIAAGTTNEQFRQWCLSPTGGNWGWTVPLNVIMVEITWGGSNGPICHGAGRRHQTLSDLVTSIELVNAKGELQTIDDPALLRAAAGCFGLLGVVTAITLKLDPMTFAAMRPTTPRLALTIPPPDGKAPAGVDMKGITKADLTKAWDAFVRHCEDDYYAEWFWFPYRKECWVNCWKDDGKRADARDYPGPAEAFIQAAENYLGQLANQTIFKLLPARWQADLMASTAMLTLPKNKTIITPVIDALHFRRGIQNMRVVDMELQIPIPALAGHPDKPDWSVCQKAWWAVVESLYTKHNTRKNAPMRIALEMRVMADSGMTMAPQNGNRFGTCSIEILTTLNTGSAEWLNFMQEITDAWTSYRDPSGAPLNVRPHWAKQWKGLTIHGTKINEHLKNVAYKDRIPEFGAGLAAVARAGGYTLADMRARFSNPLLDDIFSAILL